jgi:hypothetical protein
MSVTFRSKNEDVNTAQNASVSEPAGAAIDDLLFAVMGVTPAGGVPVPPAGWTQLFGTGSESPSDFRVCIAWIRRTGSAPSYAFTTSASAYRELHVFCFTGVDWTKTNPFEDTAWWKWNTTDTSNPDPPAVRAGNSDGLAVAVVMDWAGSGSGGWAGPTGYTIRSRNTVSDDVSVATKQLGASGVEDPAAVTGRLAAGSSTKAAASVIIRASTPPAELQRFAPWLN